MILRIGIENNTEGHSCAWALEFPGCFAYGGDASEAILRMPQAFVNYADWLEAHTPDSWLHDLGDFDIRLEDAWDVYNIDDRFNIVTEGGYSVNAWFRHDWKPLTAEDIRRGQLLLAWTRAELLDLLQLLSEDELDTPLAGERWTRRGIFAHVANAELWYLDRLGLAPLKRADLPSETRARLEVPRTALLDALPHLEGVHQVVGKDGEFWSPRKLLRRALWHERDHIDHLRKLMPF